MSSREVILNFFSFFFPKKVLRATCGKFMRNILRKKDGPPLLLD